MTSHRISRYRAEAFPQGLHLIQGGTESSDCQRFMRNVAARPVSWHPSSMASIHRRPGSMYDTPFRHSLAYQTIAVNGMPTPMTQPDSSSEIPADAWFSLDNSLSSYQPSTAYNRYDQTGLRLDTSIHNDYSVDQGTQYSLSALPTSEDFPSFCADYSTQAWTESLSQLSAYTAPPTPDLLPIQNPPMGNWQSDHADSHTLPRKDSKELIGMGLYDRPDGSSLLSGSLTDSHTSLLMSERHSSLGKGLKLEETWEPPEEDEDDSSEQEGEEETKDESKDEAVVEIEKPNAVVVANKIQLGAVDRGCVNMADQSFFFDHDDAYGDHMVVE